MLVDPSEEFRLKLIDFGLARRLTNGYTHRWDLVKNHHYSNTYHTHGEWLQKHRWDVVKSTFNLLI